MVLLTMFNAYMARIVQLLLFSLCVSQQSWKLTLKKAYGLKQFVMKQP